MIIRRIMYPDDGSPCKKLQLILMNAENIVYSVLMTTVNKRRASPRKYVVPPAGRAG